MRFESGSRRAIPWLIACTLAMPHYSAAQSIVAALASSSAGAADAEQRRFTRQALDQMLAPIALYPDGLLSQMLMASAYPRDVDEATRWLRQHPGLGASALREALSTQLWDPSVKSLCAFGGVLDRMGRDLRWTQELGDAFIAQQTDVVYAIQGMRRKAQAAGALVSNAQQIVNVHDDDITIVPQNPRVVYVPTYDPAGVFGSWWWPHDPPYYPAYWGPTGNFFTDGFYWSAGTVVGPGEWGLFDWRRHRVELPRHDHFYGHYRSDGYPRLGRGDRSAGL